MVQICNEVLSRDCGVEGEVVCTKAYNTGIIIQVKNIHRSLKLLHREHRGLGVEKLFLFLLFLFLGNLSKMSCFAHRFKFKGIDGPFKYKICKVSNALVSLKAKA